MLKGAERAERRFGEQMFGCVELFRVIFPPETSHGALPHSYVTSALSHFSSSYQIEVCHTWWGAAALAHHACRFHCWPSPSCRQDYSVHRAYLQKWMARRLEQMGLGSRLSETGELLR